MPISHPSTSRSRARWIGLAVAGLTAPTTLVLSTVGTVGATTSTPVPVTNPDPTGLYDVTSRARWGGTGFEAVLFTPGNPSPTGVQMNPVGTPAWSVGNYHAFEFTYVMATGVSTFKVDFNRDGDFLDAQESVTSTSPTLVGLGHKYLNLWMSGSSNAPGTVDVKNFTVNGTNLGNFTSNANTTPIEWTWVEDSGGVFVDVTVNGEYRMSATGSATETNRMWVRLGGAQLPDGTPPTAAPTQSPAANGNGWNNSDVTVDWNWSDTGSGVDAGNCTTSSTSSGEGSITLNATCKDLAGNEGSADYTVKVDKTNPTVAPTASPNPVMLNGIVTVLPNASDTGSGVASASCDPVPSTATPGVKTVNCTATDNAGNVGTGSVSFTVLGGQSAKQALIVTLQGLLPTGDSQADKKIKEAIKHLQKSVEPSNWIDALHPSKNTTFNEEKNAVEDLMQIKSPSPAITSAITAIVDIDQNLAQIAIDEAVSRGGNATRIANANSEMAKAAADVLAGKFDNAIDHYRNAWQQATGA
jgi:hypothetical protein